MGVVGWSPTSLSSKLFWFFWLYGCIWHAFHLQRSVEAHCLRYTEFLRDGDSKSHKLIVEQAVYEEVEVTKLECVGHVQKRLGSRLRSLKKRLGQIRLEDGKSIGGSGRLTKTNIDKLQVYYGKAIRNNSHDLQAMKNAVMAIWHHTQST